MEKSLKGTEWMVVVVAAAAVVALAAVAVVVAAVVKQLGKPQVFEIL